MPEARGQSAKPNGSEIESLTFEAALTELEGIVKSLEGGQGTLAEAIESYERGVALRQRCEKLLAEAEAKVQAIVSTPGGPMLRDVE
jgi:exodeoxyribonuclease VII small subunit